jgi:serine/threonine-protein kinase
MTRDDPAAFAPPPAFGPFRVLHQIGIGALGPVFRTYEPTRDRLVAVKVFRLDVTPEQAQLLADELGRAADAGLFHPSIVEPIAAGVEGTAAYRAEEYVAAESLDVAIRHHAPASLDKALPFLTQLAGAIDFARTAGVGHGGLHLRDIFVTPDEARASGFGIVEALERVGVRAPVRRPYSAPERIAGDVWSTPADVFSLAAIAYELLTGRRPSGTGDQIAPLAGDNVGRHAPAIHSVLARAMDDDPARRYDTALGFASALEAAARSGTSAATVIPAPAIAGAEGDRFTQDDPIEEDEGDIARERDADAAHHRLLTEMDDQPAPTLFDSAEDESVADLAIDEAAAAADDSSRWKYDGGADDDSERVTDADVLRASHPVQRDYATPVIGREGMSTNSERPRPAMLPLAFMLILGLLLGSAIQYWASGRSAPPAQTSPPASSAAQPAPAGQPQGSGRAWSEQAVAPPRTTPPPAGETPPVPGDGPPSAAGPAPAAKVPSSGTLIVRSTPPRAGVTVNGTWRGRTPLTIDALGFGPYSVRVVQPGFVAADEAVTLSAREPTRTVSVRLQRGAARGSATESAARRPGRATPGVSARPAPREPAPSSFAGTIYVDSRPRGARVLIDGRPMGTTPASIPDIPIGSHVVRLELPDHRAWTTSTSVAAGEQARVTGSLERIR